MRGVTDESISCLRGIAEFQLTRLMRGVTNVKSPIIRINRISTHTPHARRDKLRG